MNHFSLFTADHHGFYHNEAPFFPWIQESIHPLLEESNIVLVQLPAKLNEDLDWTKEIMFAQEMISSGKYILWNIDLGLATFQFSPNDSAAFYSFSLAMEEFTRTIWAKFHSHTFGVVLYRGLFQPSHSFPFFLWETAFSEWIRDLPLGTYDLYCAQILAEYLHRLISFLPDTILPFALVDLKEGYSPAQIAQLFSKERFEHIHLISNLEGALLNLEAGALRAASVSRLDFPSMYSDPASTGIYLPNDAVLNEDVRMQLDFLIAELTAEKTAFRIIPEEKLTEQWDGLDRLIVPKHSLSMQGSRKLQGFIAAGGIVL